MSNDYTHKDINILSEKEHLQTNPSMYVGNVITCTPICEECIDNSLDESLAGFATAISVSVDTKIKKYTIADNGRGIPIQNDTPLIISTKLFSSGKFKGKKTSYDMAVGLHGIGLCAVNFLSTHYNIEVYRDSKHATYLFEYGELKHKEIIDHSSSNKIPFSTCISFIPDPKIFESQDIDLNRIRLRLKIASAHLPNCIFALTIDGKTEIIKNTIVDLFKEELADKDSKYNVYSINSESKKEKFNFLFSYSDLTNTPKIISSVNFLPLKEGGSHCNYYIDLLKDYFSGVGKKYQKNFQPNDVLVGLRSYIWLLLREPEFSGQSKDKLSCKKSSYDKFERELKKELEDYFKKNETELIKLLDRFELYRKTQDAKLVEVKNAGNKKSSPKVIKLKDCTDRVNGELYLVEGDSAGGTIISARNPKIHAVLACKGKSIPNLTTKKNFLENIEIQELIKTFGCGIEPSCNMDNFRYKCAILLEDPDPDGAHIFSLTTMAIALLMPEVIKQGKLYKAIIPLFCINDTKKKIFKPLWTKEEIEDARNKNMDIMRVKGLGEFSSFQISEILLNEKNRRLYKVEYTSDLKNLVKLFSSPEEKRKLLEEIL